MSNIGKKPIKINQGVTVEVAENNLKITGPKGEIDLTIPQNLEVTKNNDEIRVLRLADDKKSRAFHGLWRMLIDNAIKGVSLGWERKLEFKGVGFKAEVISNKLILNVGFSEPIEVKAPGGIEFVVSKNVITVSGIDKQEVGQVAANIRRIRPVEPYKGKGIKYLEEVPRKKLGKAAKAVIGSTGGV